MYAHCSIFITEPNIHEGIMSSYTLLYNSFTLHGFITAVYGYNLHFEPLCSSPISSRLTCVYLSCKVDEFNVSSTQFVGNLQENPAAQERALEQILEYELLLIQQLNFHLVIHNPYRPLEGFLIDLKVRLQTSCVCYYYNLHSYEKAFHQFEAWLWGLVFIPIR